MRIMFSGGGTAGSVTPLLAIAEQLKQHDLYFVGTNHGVEQQLVIGMTYIPLLSGKLRRYFSWRNFVDHFIVIAAFFQSWFYLLKYRPAVVVSAGGFVSVPLVWAAWWCNIPTVVHHQDIRMSLATRLMKPFATTVTYATEIGNPVRSLSVTTNAIQLDPSVPTVLIMGGGTGAQAINSLVTPELCQLYNVIHSTGQDKMDHVIQHPHYHSFTLLTEGFAEALHKADIVVCRAGFGTISELVALGKASIIIPIPQSHQVDNARWLEQHHAAIVLSQLNLTPQNLIRNVQQALVQKVELEKNIRRLFPSTATTTLCQHILQFASAR